MKSVILEQGAEIFQMKKEHGAKHIEIMEQGNLRSIYLAP